MNDERDVAFKKILHTAFDQLHELEATIPETSALLSSALSIVIQENFEDVEERIKLIRLITKRILHDIEELDKDMEVNNGNIQ